MMSLPSNCPECGSESTGTTLIDTASGIQHHATFSCGSEAQRAEGLNVNQINCLQSYGPHRPESHLSIALRRADLLTEKHASKLEEYIPLLNDLVDSYLALTAHHEANMSPDIPSSSMDILLRHSCMIARQELIGGTLALLRGRLSESMYDMRRATEYALFTAWSLEHPEFADVWLLASQDEQRYKAYVDKFKIHSMLSHKKWNNLKHLLKAFHRLKDDYDVACRGVHATVYGAGQFFLDPDGVKFASSDGYGKDLEDEELVVIFLWILRAHLNVLDLLERLTIHHGAVTQEDWREQFQKVYSAIETLWCGQNRTYDAKTT
jgi:hypothetical protein